MKILEIQTSGLHRDGITGSLIDYYSQPVWSYDTVDFVSCRKADASVQKKILNLGYRIFELPDRQKQFKEYFLALQKLMRREKYDIVRAHGSSGILAVEMFAAKISGVPARIVHSHNTMCDHHMLNQLLRPFMLFFATDFFACGEDAGKWLFGKRKFTIVRNGKQLDEWAFSPEIRAKIQTQYGWTKEKMLGHVGNFNNQKNQAFVVRCFNELIKKDSHWRLVLMGADTMPEIWEEVHHIVKEDGLENKVLFMGSVSDVSQILQAMDVMILPSYYEGLPLVVLEWQAAGLPSLISDAITRECAVTNLVHFMPLSAGPKVWAEIIQHTKCPNRENTRSSIKEQLTAAGFDIFENAKQLQQIYQSICTRRKLK